MRFANDFRSFYNSDGERESESELAPVHIKVSFALLMSRTVPILASLCPIYFIAIRGMILSWCRCSALGYLLPLAATKLGRAGMLLVQGQRGAYRGTFAVKLNFAVIFPPNQAQALFPHLVV